MSIIETGPVIRDVMDIEPVIVERDGICAMGVSMVRYRCGDDECAVWHLGVRLAYIGTDGKPTEHAVVIPTHLARTMLEAYLRTMDKIAFVLQTMSVDVKPEHEQ